MSLASFFFLFNAFKVKRAHQHGLFKAPCLHLHTRLGRRPKKEKREALLMSCKGQKLKLRFRKLEHQWLRCRTCCPVVDEPECPEGGKRALYVPAVGGGFIPSRSSTYSSSSVCVQAAGAVRSHDHRRTASSRRNHLLCDNSCVEKKWLNLRLICRSRQHHSGFCFYLHHVLGH